MNGFREKKKISDSFKNRGLCTAKVRLTEYTYLH